MISLFVFLLPLGLDSLSASLSLGIKKGRATSSSRSGFLSLWFAPALLFAITEMIMPLVGLAIGYELSSVLSETLRVVGPLMLIAVGLWEVLGEVREVLEKRWHRTHPLSSEGEEKVTRPRRAYLEAVPHWIRPLLLALSVSIDELVVGFSLGTITPLAAHGGKLSLLLVCLYIGIQGGLMTIIGLALGRWLGSSMKVVKQWNEWIAGLLLIGLGAWLLLFNA